ncbi:MAG: hypothetical protein Q8O89_07480 [Nanoarchaeota archaeon]|nr:hypothetical protein [Nanoarchaeota archaeon]
MKRTNKCANKSIIAKFCVNKKGMEAISWVLFLALGVALSTFAFLWIRGFTISSSDKLVQVAYDTEECLSVSVSIDSICQDLSVVKLNLTNNNKRDVNKLLLRTYDLYGNPENREILLTLKPDEQTTLNTMKQGTLSKLEIIPVTYRNELEKKKVEIICRINIAQRESIAIC